MGLREGTKLGAYEILSPLGAGGMGEVYRARDTKLNREVALKVLPEAFASDPQRMARFEREAQVLASLNHPNIAAIYGLEESGSTRALVMELVEGETLAERLASRPLTGPASRDTLSPPAGRGQRVSEFQPSPSGRGWPAGSGEGFDDALAIAKQVAEALEYAHERGVVHRDLKPANIKITPEGTVKVLDFGLAKAMGPGSSPAAHAGERESKTGSGGSATVLLPAGAGSATEPGLIMGTAAYMSLEQASARPVDRRCDIWAFGCVLYEMLAGQRAFAGESIAETLARVVLHEPDWSALPQTTPPAIQRLAHRCLQKDPRRRLRDIGEARITIEETISGAAGSETGPTAPPAAGLNRAGFPAPLRAMPWVAAGVVLGAALAYFFLRPSPAGQPLRKFELKGGRLAEYFNEFPEISPNGKAIIYHSGNDLLIRDLDQLEPRKLYTLTGRGQVFWSPDSEWIAFEDQGKLWSIRASGGAAVGICSLPGPIIGGAWGADGTIFFSVWRGDMYKVSAEGGDPKALGLHDPKTEVDFHDVTFLPGGRDLMFIVHLVGSNTRVDVLAGGKEKTVFSQSGWNAWGAAYSPTGHLVLMRMRGNASAGIWATPFSLRDLQVTGQPFVVAGDGEYPSISSDGTLLYVKSAPPGEGKLVWVSRSGKIVETIGEPMKGLENPALSPDGRRIAVVAQEESGNQNVYALDLASGVATPLLTSSQEEVMTLIDAPFWTRDGKHVLFSTGDYIIPTIEIEPADGSSQPRQLHPGILSQSSSRGNYLAYVLEREDGTSRACYAAFDDTTSQGPEAKPTCLPRVSMVDSDPQISPDGTYAAFVAESSGQLNVYVTHFPDGAGRWQASTNGGASPVWSPRGDELFYIAGDELMSVKVSLHPSLSLGAPAQLFSFSSEHLEGATVLAGLRFDVSPDGQRFLLVQQVGEKPQPTLVVDQNWFAEFAGNRYN